MEDGRLVGIVSIGDVVKSAIEMAPDDPRPLAGLAMVYSNIGRVDESIDLYKKSLALDLKNPDAPGILDRLFASADVVPMPGGTAAMVRGRATIRLKDIAPYAVLFLDVWALRNGAWQMVAWQATRVP